MVSMALWLLGILMFLVAIALSVGLHEAGHMVVAKKLGIPVPKFFIGFGKTIWSKKIGPTEYGFKAIPLGGFIQVEDVSQPEGSVERALLSYISPWKRILIFLAGPAVNLVLGVTILFFLLLSSPVMMGSNIVNTVTDCSKGTCFAKNGGILPGDTIVQIDGKEIKNFNDMKGKFSPEGSTVLIKRNGDLKTFKIKSDSANKIGIYIKNVETKMTPLMATKMIGNIFTRSLYGILEIPKHIPETYGAVIGKTERPEESPSSVVGVGRAYGDMSSTDKITVDNKIRNLISYTALLNIGLGLANLIPMLPLDGGRIFVALMDSIKGVIARIRKREYTPVDYKWIGAMTAVTGSMIIFYMGLLILADFIAPIKVI